MAKVLIIEDNVDLYSIYKSELEYNGFEVTVLSTGAEAAHEISLLHPQLILLDIMLPDIDGLELLKSIKSNELYNDIKVIMMSNIDAPAVINKAYAFGADGYLIKSMILPSQLTDEVKSFLK